MTARRFRSFAKINLGLEVMGKLPSGFHQLKTLFASVSLHDIIEVAPAKRGITVVSNHKDVPADKTNLAYRAAELMQQIGGLTKGVTITIQKRIPVGGGVGGGSSNAATVLRALDSMWSLNLGASGLEDAARALGADVPYFLHGGPALGLGRGDDIHPLDLKMPGKLLLVPNQEGVSTAAVFRRFAMQAGFARVRSPIDVFLRSAERAGEPSPVSFSHLTNDLEPAAIAENPLLAKIGRDVRRVAKSTKAVQAAMSGSGSTFFLLHRNADERSAAAVALRALGIRSVSCTFVSRRAYERRFEIQTRKEPRSGAR